MLMLVLMLASLVRTGLKAYAYAYACVANEDRALATIAKQPLRPALQIITLKLVKIV